MKRLFGMLIAIVFAIALSNIALARGAPKQKAFTSKAAVASVTPMVASVPTMVGYDVIEIISKESAGDFAVTQNTLKVDTSARTGLSTTGNEHSINAELANLLIGRPKPAQVLLA